MKKIYSIIGLILYLCLMFIVNEVKAFESYPVDGDVGIPSGYTESCIQIPFTDLRFFPALYGPTYNTTRTFLSYRYDPELKNVYNPLTTCEVVGLIPNVTNSDSYPNTLYTGLLEGGTKTFSFTTDPLLYSIGETTFKTYTSPSHHKPAGAICNQGTVKVWQEKSLGIRAQRYKFTYDSNGKIVGEVIFGPELVVGNSTKFYSPDVGPSISMNSSCKFAIAFMKDWNTYNLSFMDLWVKVYDWTTNSSPVVTTYINKTWNSYVLSHKEDYEMQYDVASPGVSIIDSGEYTVNTIMPKCFDRGGELPNKPRFQCDNYVMTWRYSANGQTKTVLGDNKNTVGNTLTPYGSTFKPTNKIPFIGNYNYRDLSKGCYGQGSAYDCPYHDGVAGSNYGWIVWWVEGEGNFGGDMYNGGNKAYKDDLVVRLFKNDSAATPIIPETPMTTKQGTKSYDHWSPGCDINDAGHIACTGVCKYCNNMQTNPIIEMTDVIGRFMNPDGTWKSIEFTVPDRNNYEQYNAAVAINNFDEALFCWKSYGTDCGGYGIYCKMYDWNTGQALGNQFRVNWFNGLIVDTEEDYNLAQSNAEWSFPVSVSKNKAGDFLVTYSYPDRIFLNTASKAGIPASYGQGYSVKSNILRNH